ncbi:MAG: HDOD domain-containing protein [Proteobacteria bacterium]|nr:MAG: HDOD domain-containing protein [Pseudomonadota bacterium]QKK10981.1 MAG: HDOD domain-containing protein [Pseudomonadota bacterium]
MTTSKHLDIWIEKLSAQPLPVLRSTRNALRQLIDRGTYNGGELTRHLAHDPLLCVHLLRRANQRSPEGRVATLEQAVVMCGEGLLEELARSVPVIEEVVPEPALQPLLQLYRFSFHVGYLARDLTKQKRDHHYSDSYFAGLLHNLGELVTRVFVPKYIPAIVRQAQQRKIGRSEAAQEVLGFDFHQLSCGLARAWHLPALLQASLDDDHFQDKRTELVDLAAGMMHVGPLLLLPLSEDRLVLRVAELLAVGAEEVKAIVFHANSEAAAYLQERLPVEPDATFVEFFPPEPIDSFEGAKPAPVRAKPEALQRLQAAFASSETDRLTPQRILELFTAALREGLGVDRVVFALLSPDHAMLQGRFFGGVQANSPLHRFEFERHGRTVFARLMDKPAALILNDANRERMKPLLTDHVHKVLEVEEFMAHSIFLEERPFGLCYADRGISRRSISAEEYQVFRTQCQLLVKRLASLTVNRKKAVT